MNKILKIVIAVTLILSVSAYVVSQQQTEVKLKEVEPTAVIDSLSVDTVTDLSGEQVNATAEDEAMIKEKLFLMMYFSDLI